MEIDDNKEKIAHNMYLKQNQNIRQKTKKKPDIRIQFLKGVQNIQKTRYFERKIDKC